MFGFSKEDSLKSAKNDLYQICISLNICFFFFFLHLLFVIHYYYIFFCSMFSFTHSRPSARYSSECGSVEEDSAFSFQWYQINRFATSFNWGTNSWSASWPRCDRRPLWAERIRNHSFYHFLKNSIKIFGSANWRKVFIIKTSARCELLCMNIAIPDVNGIIAITVAKRISFQHDVDDIRLLDGLQWTGRADLKSQRRNGY